MLRHRYLPLLVSADGRLPAHLPRSRCVIVECLGMWRGWGVTTELHALKSAMDDHPEKCVEDHTVLAGYDVVGESLTRSGR